MADPRKSLQDFRTEFDLEAGVPELIYLNNGTHSITPRRALDLADRARRAYEKNPTLSLLTVWRRVWETQTRLGRFFNATPEDLFLRSNVTHVMNDFIFGLELPAGSEIWLSDLEYGAVRNLCRLRCEQKGYALKTFMLPEPPKHPDPSVATSDETPVEFAERLLDTIPSSASVLVLSHVTTGTGLVMPLREIARRTRERGILLVVDGAHAPGSIPVDFGSDLQDVDFYAGNLHKWMMGPKGTAFGRVPKRNQDRLAPVMGGWTTYETNEEFLGHAARENRFQGRMLTSACQDFSPFLGLNATLDLWEEYGAEEIRSHIHELNRYAEQRVTSELGWRCLSPPHSPLGFRGPLAAFEIPSHLATRGFGLIAGLAREIGVQLNAPTVRGQTTLRFSPHAYNTEAEIDEAVWRLKRVG